MGDRVSKTTQEKRIAICEDCEFRKGRRCGKCGCFYRLKVRLMIFRCPAGKFDAMINLWPFKGNDLK